LFLRELAKVLKPIRLEQRLLRDLQAALRTKDKNDEVRIVRSGVFYAYLSGKISAVRKLGHNHDYSIGDFDLSTIQEMRKRYLNDLDAIKREAQDEATSGARVAALCSAIIWDAFNRGKLSSFRQRAEGKVGEVHS
jgi:hypothetical protein